MAVPSVDYTPRDPRGGDPEDDDAHDGPDAFAHASPLLAALAAASV